MGLQSTNVSIMSSMDNNHQEQKNTLEKYAKHRYALLPFVEDFVETNTGLVPKIKTKINAKDIAATILVRSGIGRWKSCNY